MRVCVCVCVCVCMRVCVMFVYVCICVCVMCVCMCVCVCVCVCVSPLARSIMPSLLIGSDNTCLLVCLELHRQFSWSSSCRRLDIRHRILGFVLIDGSRDADDAPRDLEIPILVRSLHRPARDLEKVRRPVKLHCPSSSASEARGGGKPRGRVTPAAADVCARQL